MGLSGGGKINSRKIDYVAHRPVLPDVVDVDWNPFAL